jgi:hypothetical protein
LQATTITQSESDIGWCRAYGEKRRSWHFRIISTSPT